MTAADFVERINAHDAEGLGRLMTEDHRFVDAAGVVHDGREAMMTGWRLYFDLFPDYRIQVTEWVTEGDRVAGSGWAAGSYKGDAAKAWRMPVAWMAIIREGKIAEWRVYADIEPMMRSLGMRRFE